MIGSRNSGSGIRGGFLSIYQPIILSAYFIIFVLAGCAYQKPVSFLHSEYHQRRPSLIAVLPFDNMSVDLDATQLIRPIVQQRLIYKGYRCVPLEQVDRTLKDNGVMVSHDVYMFKAQELGNLLGVDGLIYGTVTEFNKRYAFLYSDIIVGLKLEMIDAKTGDTLWKDERISSQNTLLDSLLLAINQRSPEESLVAVMAYNTAFALLSQYRPYAEDAVREALLSLPAGPYGESLYPWDINHSVWQDDIVDPWLRSYPLIRAYYYEPKPSKPEDQNEEDSPGDGKKKTKHGKKKDQPDLTIQVPGPKSGTGVIININPSSPDKSDLQNKKAKNQNQSEQKSDSKKDQDKNKEPDKKTDSGKSESSKQKSGSDKSDSNKSDKKDDKK